MVRRSFHFSRIRAARENLSLAGRHVGRESFILISGRAEPIPKGLNVNRSQLLPRRELSAGSRPADP